MLRKLMSAGPQMSRGLIRAIAGVTALLYAIVYTKASTFLPEFVFRDAEKIKSQIGGSNTYQGTSFDAVAKFYTSLGSVGTGLFVVGTGVLLIWIVIGQSRRLGSLAVNFILIAPCIFFNLFVASKDTLVVLMAIALQYVARRCPARYVMLAAVALYSAYAVIVRSYFALILAAMIGAWIFRLASLRIKLTLALALGVLLYLLPGEAYVALLHPRDMAVDYLASGSPYGARKSFYNPFDPATFVAFCADYAYAALRLNVPILFSPGPKEFAMQIFVWIALSALFRRAQNNEHTATSEALEMLTCLVIGHICVSMLFEPDLGSYIRHLSSVSLFCALQLGQFERRARRLQKPILSTRLTAVS
jgi:hypothetical protein